MQKQVSLFGGAAAAGIMIGIGGTVFLSCEDRVVGAVLFSVALLCICAMGMRLYTGAIGYLALPSRLERPYLSYPVIFAGNLVGVGLCAAAVRLGGLTVNVRAAEMGEKKLTQSPGQTILLAVLCGVLMYAAVEIWRAKATPAGIFFCVPVFILCGFEHSVADAYYFAVGGLMGRPRTWLFLLCAVIGNSIGAMLIAWLCRLANPPKEA